jgi:hypothetical protein
MTELKKRRIVTLGGIVIVLVGAYFGWKAYEAKRLADAAWPTLNGGIYASAVTRDGVTSLIPGDEVYSSGIAEDGIPALTNPKYASVAASDAVIADDLYGIDLELNGEHRFYPVQILNWHEVVNDSWGDRDIAVTYCPLCGTGIVYDRNIDLSFDNFPGIVTLSFAATGQVYNNNSLLKDDKTGSLWVQGLGTAVQGSSIGRSLEVIPSTMMQWKTWKAEYPSGLVLSTDTGVARDYTRHPYGGYDNEKGVYFPMNFTSPDFTSKWVVYGVSEGEGGVAFSDTVLKGTGLNSAKIVTGAVPTGDEPVIAVYDFSTDNVRVFVARRPDEEGVMPGSGMTFSYDFAKKRLTDSETNSVWNAQGLAISGDLKGLQLRELTAVRGYWACIAALHPTWTAITGASVGE